MRERIHSLDILRMSMMFLGVLVHSIQIFVVEIPLLSKELNNQIVSTIITASSIFRMQLFYLLSGYFSMLLLEKYGIIKFISNRAQRLGIPFVLSVFVIGIISNMLQIAIDSNIQLSGLSNIALSSVLNKVYFCLARPNHLWFLYYLLLFMPLVLFLHFLIREYLIRDIILSMKIYKLISNNFLKFSFFLLLFFNFFILTQGSDADLPNSTFKINPSYFLYYFYFFVFGWLLYKIKFDLALFKRNSVLTLLLAVVLTITRGKIWQLQEPLRVFLCGLTTYCYVVGLIGFAQKFFDRKSTLVRYLSNASYWVYLVHFPMLLVLKFIVTPNYSFLGFLFLFTIQCCLSLLTYHFFVRSTFLGLLLNGKKQSTNLSSELQAKPYIRTFKKRGSVQLLLRKKVLQKTN